jgi:alginate O-acetyltransferase complex protein AlgJ
MAAIDPATREAIAKLEVGHTDVAPATVRLLVIAFLAMIGSVALVEPAALRGAIERAVTERRPELQLGRADRHLGRSLLARNRDWLARMSAFERGLEDQSRIGQALRPPAQRLLTGWLGAGNERVYPGRDGWLFYRPDVDYVTGAGFLEVAGLERRVAAAEEWEEPPQPDPREAIVRFHEQLAARGISLIVMPTPLKPSVQPEMLAARYADAEHAPQNRSFAGFVAMLIRSGVLVFDPTPALFAARRGAPQYLATDTHWRPEAMESVADRLAAFIDDRLRLPSVPSVGYRVERAEVRNVGDTVRMLDLPETQTLFPPESVWLRRVLLPDGALWRSSRDADVLVLGDSFSNIYSLESMGWGTSAGFVEQLSFALGRPVARIVQNDEGASATRDILQREPGRLAGKRVVIWQFAARELAFGNWRLLR